MHELTLQLDDEAAMTAFGAKLAGITQGHGLIFLKATLEWARPPCHAA